MNSQQKRKILMLKDNIDKIIENGIKPNLLKLEKSFKIIKSNNRASMHLLSKECMTARLTIQQLQANLSELEKCHLALKELKIEADYDHTIHSFKRYVLREIENFTKTNEEFDYKFYTDIESNSTHDSFGDIKITKDEVHLLKSRQALQDVQSINQDIEDLHNLVNKFGTLVHDQQSQVNHIEENIENAKNNVREGTKSLAKAASTSMVPIACAAVGASIFGPIGALISFKISTGVASAFGGSILSYSLASYIKNKNKTNVEL